MGATFWRARNVLLHESMTLRSSCMALLTTVFLACSSDRDLDARTGPIFPGNGEPGIGDAGSGPRPAGDGPTAPNGIPDAPAGFQFPDALGP